MSSHNSRIARPSSMVLTSSVHLPITARSSKVVDYQKKQKIKRPSSRLSKSHSMHRLDYHSDDDDEDDYSYLLQQKSEMKRRTLLSRATTTPYVPKPSSLIKRFSDHSNSGVLTSTKMSNNNNTTSTTEMRRSASLMNPQQQRHGGDLVAVAPNFRLGQRVTVPSLNVVGTIRFFGETKFKEKGSIWVGIELDIKGSGKNDGSVQGVRYFSCPPETGLFVVASKVIVLEEYSSSAKITPRISKTTTTATAKKSNSSSTTTTKRKSMIITTTTTTTRTTTTPKKNRSMTTSTNTMKPSKSARTSSSTRSTQPLPTRSSPYEKPALKKSSSLSTSTLPSPDACHHHRSTPPKRSVRANTLPNSTDKELKRIQTLLEQSRQEQRALAQQMDGKEAAWEKLVSVKESYAVRVQEKDDEIVRLKRLLEQAQPTHEQFVKITSERDAALSRAKMSEAMEKQHSKVIERLDARVHDLQQKLVDQSSAQESQNRDHAAQMDQLRKQLSERDESTATIERECAELKRANVETVRAFEQTIKELQKQHQVEQMRKEAHIARLEQMVNDFQQIYPTTPVTPIDEDENSPRRRLEAQLELTTIELDRERQVIKSQAMDIEQLKDEIKRLHRVSVCSSSQFYTLRTELESEIEDKRRIMEEANAALESQARMEDENERLKLTLEKTQHDLADVLRKLATVPNDDNLVSKCKALEMENEQLKTTQKQTEHECMRLMDELLAIEKVESQETNSLDDEKSYRREIEQLKLQVAREAKRYKDLETVNQEKIHRLQKELSDLESLVENKVFNETELEEAIECEKRKVQMLESRLREEEEKNKTNWVRSSNTPLSPTSPQQQPKRSSSRSTVSDLGNMLESAYCEICEELGHDVMTCNAFKQASMYCVNCDVFDTHSTENCPNQDETF